MLRLLHALALLSIAACTACGGGSSSTTDTGTADSGAVTDSGTTTDSGTATDSGETADSGDSLDGAVGACGYVDTLDPTCTVDADCAVGLHQTDCCGSSVMIGYRVGQEATYAASESACMATYPDCQCAAMLPRTDSDEMVTDTSAVLAACVSRGPRNVCLTYVATRPLPGR